MRFTFKRLSLFVKVMFEDVTFDDDCYATLYASQQLGGMDGVLFLFPRDGENGMEWEGMGWR